MFKFLKSLFQTQQETVVEQVQLNQLDNWLNTKIPELPLMHEVREYREKLAFIQKSLKENLEILQKAEISEKDHKGVDQRIKNKVLGHRDNYVAIVNRFNDAMAVPQKEETILATLQKTIQAQNQLKNDLNELGKNSAKSYSATQYLIAKPLEDVFKTLGELHTLLKNFSSKSEKLQNITNIFTTNSLINENKAKKEDITQKSHTKKQEIEELQKTIPALEKKLKELTESQEHKLYNTMRAKEEKYKAQQRDVENQVFQFFSKFQKVFRKYERVALNPKILSAYLKDSVQAFTDDASLEILQTLEGLEKWIADNKVLVPQKKQEQYAQLLEKAKQGHLKTLQSELQGAVTEVSRIQESIEKSSITEKIAKAQNSIIDTKNKIERFTQEAKDLQDKLMRVDPAQLQQDLAIKIKDHIGIEITFSS